MAADLYRTILPADDLARADAFWSDLLQIPVDAVTPGRHYFPTAGAILAIVDASETGDRVLAPNPDCLYVRVPDLDAAWERAQALGAPPPTGYMEAGIARRDWGDRSFYTADPFGNPVCLIDDLGSDVRPEGVPYSGKPIANLCTTVLPTRSMGRSDAFFEALLGLEPDTYVPGRHTFYCDSCMLTLVDTVEHARAHELPAPEFRPNSEFTYFAVDDLEATFETARKLSIDTVDVRHHLAGGIQTRPWGERSFYGLDPSGNPICFVDPATLFTGSHCLRSA